MTTISKAALLLFTTASSLSFAAGQRLVVVTSARDNNTPMMMRTLSSSSPLFTTGAVHSHGSYISAEPPCRSRRLEPFRQHVREECRLDAATHCYTAEPERRTMLTTPTTYTNDVWLNSLMQSVLESPSSSSSSSSPTSEDAFETIMNSMLNEFFEQMHMMYQEVDGTDSPVLNNPSPEVQSDSVKAHDVKEDEAMLSTRSSRDTSASSSSSSDDNAATSLDEVAENSLDVLIATLAQRFIDGDDENNSADKVDTTLPSSSQRVESFSTRLSQLGNDLLSETRRARRRRLQEASSSGEDADAMDHQMQVKERLARRLTEYRTDLVYHPGGMVTVYTSSFQPHSTSSSFFPHAICALPSDTIVSPLGMGSTHVDECMKSRYENGDLSGSCFNAVDGFFAAVNNRSLSPPSQSTRSNSNNSGDGEPWYKQQVPILPLLFWLIFGLFMEICVRPCFIADKENDDDDDDENRGGDSFDYEMLPEEEHTNSTDHECRAHQEEKKEAVPRVYLGVPVQVV